MKRKYKEPIMKPVELKVSTILVDSTLQSTKFSVPEQGESDETPATQGYSVRSAW